MAEYKVGDRGVTRDDENVKCVDDRGDGFMFPLEWTTDDGRRWWTTRNGCRASNDVDWCQILRLADDDKIEPQPDADDAANDDVMSEILGGFENPGSFIATVENHGLAKDIVSKGIVGNCEAATAEPPSTLRTPAKFESDEHVIDGVHIVATCGGGIVSLFIDGKELSESDVAVLLRTIETVMEQARRAKGVMG